jgi:ubiquitin carboxyl-terminal hydrolase 22/27/51
MSVILQSLIHNPLIRTFYLAEGHRSTDCDRDACTSCALDDIFTDFYAQDKHEGYGAVHMLQGCWKGGGGLAGYSQQDAHEFFGFILNSLHEANIEDDEKPEKPIDAKDCECIVHQTFGGLLRSTVTCGTCKNTTTALDPVMDLSLDVKNAGFSIKKKKLAMINGTQTVKEALPMDLSECLERFTNAETLSTDSYFCRKCNENREAKKKLTLARLPPVLPIHLKRFSHTKSNSQSNKVDTKVRFPFTLDLAPYISSAAAQAKAKPHAPAEDDPDNIDVKTRGSNGAGKDAAPPEPIYELSSVVVHKGKIDNGHYVSYARQGQEWFRFDDSMVVQVDEKEVLGAEAYMLFYVVREF